jgi:hypothetical protein
MGGFASWLAQSRVRRERRQWQREADRLGRELDNVRRSQRPLRPTAIDADDFAESN